MRRLMILPIVHSRSDLGSLQSAANSAKVAALGLEGAAAAERCIDKFWQDVRLVIEHKAFDFNRLVIYQDGLPVVNNAALQIEKRIVEDLARAGSPNHLLVQGLVERGAILVGTESPELLLQEYQAVRRNLADGFRNVLQRQSETAASAGVQSDGPPEATLLNQRDRFIANRIDTTLGTEQQGLLFIGMLHAVEAYLPADIEVEYPVGQPQRRLLTVIQSESLN